MASGYAYEFLLGSGAWLGYAVASLYFFGLEYDFGKELCEAMGYGYEVIDALNSITEFAGVTKEESGGDEEYADFFEYRDEPAEVGQDWFEGIDDSDTTGEAVIAWYQTNEYKQIKN